MAKRGRKPKPTEAKRLAGNPGKRPLPENEPQPAGLAELPPPPAWLLPEAVAEWERLGPQLVTLGLLTVVDVPAFAALCQCWARYVQADVWIQENGICMTIRNDKGEVKFSQPAPRFSIAKAMLEKWQRLAAEFGLTPSSRVGLNGVGNAKPKTSALAEYARKRAESQRKADERKAATAKRPSARKSATRPAAKKTARKKTTAKRVTKKTGKK